MRSIKIKGQNRIKVTANNMKSRILPKTRERRLYTEKETRNIVQLNVNIKTRNVIMFFGAIFVSYKISDVTITINYPVS